MVINESGYVMTCIHLLPDGYIVKVVFQPGDIDV